MSGSFHVNFSFSGTVGLEEKKSYKVLRTYFEENKNFIY
jgi:hypothetical protein